MPFTGVIDEAANLPLWQFEREQDEHGIGPGTRLNVLFDPLEVFRPPDRWQARAHLPDDFRQKLCRDRIGVTNLAGNAGERLTHATNIFGGAYEFESGKPSISYEIHKLRETASAKRHGGFKRASEAAQRRKGHGLVPVIEGRFQRFLTIECRDDAAEDG